MQENDSTKNWTTAIMVAVIFGLMFIFYISFFTKSLNKKSIKATDKSNSIKITDIFIKDIHYILIEKNNSSHLINYTSDSLEINNLR